MRCALTLALTLLLALAACGDDDIDDGDASRPTACEGVPGVPMPSCGPMRDEYVPGEDDTFPPCPSDDGEFHPIDERLAAIPRVEAFERIADLLFDPRRDPSREAFTMARAIYEEPEGLGSRVARRVDPHFMVPDGTDCAMGDAAQRYPDYCVGAAKLTPTVLDAFTAGAAGEGRSRVHAARIEAALLWFFLASTYRESETCKDKAADCDAAAVYYTGDPRTGDETGLARYVRAVDPAAADAARLGYLAVSCWRHVDRARVATNDALQQQARTQYDRAVTDGVAAIVRDRIARTCTSSGAEREYYFASIAELGPALLREAAARDEARSAVLRAAFQAEGELDAVAATSALDAIFDCP